MSKNNRFIMGMDTNSRDLLYVRYNDKKSETYNLTVANVKAFANNAFKQDYRGYALNRNSRFSTIAGIVISSAFFSFSVCNLSVGNYVRAFLECTTAFVASFALQMLAYAYAGVQNSTRYIRLASDRDAALFHAYTNSMDIEENDKQVVVLSPEDAFLDKEGNNNSKYKSL